MLPFALSLFTGAFLLFALQPLIGKYIVPWFGGLPGVWTTCLLFFQTLLLAGYAYAHFTSTRLSPRRQVLVHLSLLVLAMLLLPITPDASWKPQGDEDPIFRILALLTVSVGLPYFVLSATGPLMQQWFSRANPGVPPYRLYALSNAGSLLALLAYPFYFEYTFARTMQATLWGGGLVIISIFAAWSGARVWKFTALVSPEKSDDPLESARPAPLDTVLWFVLAAVASILLLATTNKLTQDLAVVPFLWVLPLSLYLLTFILCFDHPRWYSRSVFSALFALGALVDVYLLGAGHSARLWQQVVGYTITLFAGCMICHGELYRLRPAPRHLTRFYLWIAAGGATGSLFVALGAPYLFDGYFELHVGLWLTSYLIGALCFRQRTRALAAGLALGTLAALFVVPALSASALLTKDTPPTYWSELMEILKRDGWFVLGFALIGVVTFTEGRRWLSTWQPRVGGFVFLLSTAFGVVLLVQIAREQRQTEFSVRNFYGVLHVFEHDAHDPALHYLSLVNGVTAHGMQFVSWPQSAWPTTYYGRQSGVGLAIDRLPPGERHIGLVGLGVGTLAAYGEPGDRLRIYEINPEVIKVAEDRFSYLSQSRAEHQLVLGDARLSMEQELARGEPQEFDVLALDAFSSDAIPVHLLTKEAFEIYLKHLKPDGVIAVHTSNRYLNLEPIVHQLARHFGCEAFTITDFPDRDKRWLYGTTWILVTRNPYVKEDPAIAALLDDPPAPLKSGPLWTDDQVSLFKVLK